VILSQFDKKAGKFKTVMEYPPLDVKSGVRRTIAAAFYHHDMKLGIVPDVNLTFAFVTDQSASQHPRDISLLVNGRPWAFGELVRYDSRKLEKGLVLETATLTLSYENLQEIIRARSVQARLGALDYQLSFDNLEALREIASQVEPYASWNKWKTIGARRP
jgi:hypothetical protein